MTTTQWPNWVARLSANNQLIAVRDVTRGVAYSFTLKAHADVSADSFSAAIKSGPDASGSPLATFGVSVGSFSNGVTTITFSLAAASTDFIADGDSDGVAEAVFDILHTPSGLSAYRVAAGSIWISGAVT